MRATNKSHFCSQQKMSAREALQAKVAKRQQSKAKASASASESTDASVVFKPTSASGNATSKRGAYISAAMLLSLLPAFFLMPYTVEYIVDYTRDYGALNCRNGVL